MSENKEKTYSIEFKCSNCFMVFKEEFPRGIMVDKCRWRQGYRLADSYEDILCPNCLGSDIGKTEKFVQQEEDKEAGHGQIYCQE